MGRFVTEDGIGDNVSLGACGLCGTRCGSPYVNTGRYIDFEGRLFIGEACFRELAEFMGYDSPHARKLREAKLAKAEDALKTATEKLAYIREHVLGK